MNFEYNINGLRLFGYHGVYENEKKDAEKSFKINVRNHIKDIAEKYINEGLAREKC